MKKTGSRCQNVTMNQQEKPSLSTSDEDENVKGDWRREKVLGTGGFGRVDLWRNQKTNEPIAIKECRWGNDAMMTPKHRQRWKLEVEIMRKLKHPNVITALEVPSALDTSSSNLPLLAMEYCAGGDLRKKFGKPENCCGLPEKNVRIFLHQIASAVEYLHKRRIIHRDLKPENILLQENDGKLQYKLIDLGYAKELDQGSICTSFVGTLQYLAPELFHSKRYSYTVDYWSLGLVTHEIIVGYRPFLPSLSPAQWIPFAEKKSSSTITMYLDNEGKIHCSEEMSPYNNISRVFQKYLEDWLQIMLEWDPHTRGHRNGRKAFDILKDILDKKVIEVFVVKTCKTLSYEVDDTTKLFHLQQWIEEDTQIPVSEQELLLPQGVALDPDKSICQYWSNQEGEELLLYMFDRRPQFADEEVNFNYHPMVETMMRNPKTPVSYEDQKKSWAYAVYLCQQEKLCCRRLINSYRIRLMYMMSKTSKIHKKNMKMMTEMCRLSAVAEFFQSSVQQDLRRYEEQVKSAGLSCNRLKESWKQNIEIVEKNIHHLQATVGSLESRSSTINTKSIDLQRSPYAKAKQVNPLEEVTQSVMTAYDRLKRRPKEHRSIHADNTDMVRLLCQCLQCRKLTYKDIFCHLRKLNDAKKDVELIEPELDDARSSLQEFHTKIADLQANHQLELWKTIKTLAHQLRSTKSDVKEAVESNNNTSFQSNYSPITSSTNSVATKSIPSDDQSLIPSQEEDMGKAEYLPKRSDTSISQACTSQMSGKSTPVSSLANHSLSTILAVNSEQNKVLKNENQACYNKLNSMLSAFEQQHRELLTSVTDFDFTYLKKDSEPGVKDKTQNCLD